MPNNVTAEYELDSVTMNAVLSQWCIIIIIIDIYERHLYTDEIIMVINGAGVQ